MRTEIFLKMILLTGFLLSACASTPSTAPPSQQEHPTAAFFETATASTPDPIWTIPAPVIERNPEQDPGSAIALTHQRLDGNRLVTGSGGMPTQTIDIPLLGKPLWVVAAPVSTGSVWAAWRNCASPITLSARSAVLSAI